MKAVIEKAIENGFDLKSLFVESKRKFIHIIEWHYTEYETYYSIYPEELRVFYRVPDFIKACKQDYSLVDLIFLTDFIDKLIQSENTCKYCSKRGDLWKDKYWCTEDNQRRKETESCYGFILNDKFSALYHRSVMANILDIEKLKEYIRGLV